MIVADTGPLNYLIQIGEIELLRAVFGRVLVPREVVTELRHARSPMGVQSWASAPPEWVEVVQVADQFRVDLYDLDPGERAAIELALERDRGMLLIDDVAGRRSALRAGLAVCGTIGVLKRASGLGMVDLREAVDHLRATNFRVSESIVKELLNG